MDDREAFMQLVLDNNQGELTPLEIGMHALDWGGEQKAYAERTGYGKSYISQLRSAAGVARVYSSKPGDADLNDKSKHLYEVSKAPRSCWAALTGALTGRAWTVADTSRHVAAVNQLAEAIPDRHGGWLPLPAVAARYIAAPEREFRGNQHTESGASENHEAPERADQGSCQRRARLSALTAVSATPKSVNVGLAEVPSS